MTQHCKRAQEILLPHMIHGELTIEEAVKLLQKNHCCSVDKLWGCDNIRPSNGRIISYERDKLERKREFLLQDIRFFSRSYDTRAAQIVDKDNEQIASIEKELAQL